jgi:hypothetical protein
MRFSYASYEIEPSPTIPGGVLYRPEMAIDVIGPMGLETVRALVDTGSDETVFPASLARAIGVGLDHSLGGQASAVGGHSVELVPGVVTLRIAQNREEFRWEATVEFLDVERAEDEVALLGYAGFLEFFHASFDSEVHEFELIRNAQFPHSE